MTVNTTETFYEDKLAGLLDEERKKGLKNFKMFVSANKDSTSEDIAQGAAAMLEAYLARKTQPLEI